MPIVCVHVHIFVWFCEFKKELPEHSSVFGPIIREFVRSVNGSMD